MGRQQFLPQGFSSSSSFPNNNTVKKNLNYHLMPAVCQTSSQTRISSSFCSLVVKSKTASGFCSHGFLAASLGQITSLSAPQYFTRGVVVRLKQDGKTCSTAPPHNKCSPIFLTFYFEIIIDTRRCKNVQRGSPFSYVLIFFPIRFCLIFITL